MKGSFDYRGYRVRRKGWSYIATSCDDDGFEITSRSLHRTLRYIDEVWSATDNVKAPYPSWMGRMVRGECRFRPDRSFYAQAAFLLTSGAVAVFFLCFSLDLHHALLDVDRDGRVALNDLHLLLNKVVTGEYEGHPVVKTDDGIYQIDIHPNQSREIDFSMLMHRVEPRQP